MRGKKLKGPDIMNWANVSDEERKQSVIVRRLGASLETLHRISAWVGEKWKSHAWRFELLGYSTGSFTSWLIQHFHAEFAE